MLTKLGGAASALCLALPAFGQCAAPAAMYAQSETLSAHIGTVRYVKSALMTNNVDGDFKLEFTARRTDLASTNERWTVTYEKSAENDYVQHVFVDGIWRHSVTYADSMTQPKIAIEVEGISVRINVIQPCLDPGAYEIFKMVAAQTAADRAVVAQVSALFHEAIDDEEEPDPYTQCWQACDQPPLWCQDLDPNVDCVYVHACCVATCQYSRCVAECWCEFGPNPGDPDECCQEQEAFYYGCVDSCLQSLIDCLNGGGC